MNIFPRFLMCLVSIVLYVDAGPAFGRHPDMIDQNYSSELIEREGHTLFLNGRATHTVSIFEFQVYEISLFLEQRSVNAEEILKSPKRKLVILKFLRNLEAEQLRTAFLKGFEENCDPLCNPLKGYLDQLNSKMTNFKEGDELEFQFFPPKVIIQSKLGHYSTVNSPEFARTLLSIWLGSNPPSTHLKNGILGLNK